MEDSIASPVGLADTSVRRLEGFDLERFLAFFFKDLPLSRSDDLPSNILLTLLKLGRITWRSCSDLVVHHKIATGASRFHREFSDTLLEASGRIPALEDDPRIGGRRDLRNLETYTIDPDDAKDFDDAVSLVPSKDGAVVFVHIADVTHYVRPDDPVDSEARFRATSVYLPSGVLPMLPPRLSEDLCSLREGEDRLAMTVKIRLDPDRNVIDSEFFPSVIRVRRNLTYDMVERAIEEGAEPFTALYAITEHLSRSARRMGIETPERRVRFSADDEITTTMKRATRSTRMIEELMVLTNERAAGLLAANGATCVYRVHPIADVSSLERFNSACDVLGVPIRIEGDWTSKVSKGEGGPDADEDSMLKALLSGGKLSFGSLQDITRTDPSDGNGAFEVDREKMDAALDAINEALCKVHALPEQWMRDLLSFSLLRSVPKALYSLDNIGHFGLRSERYCHFTSPIRRYADVLVHRAIKALLSSEGIGTDATWEMPEREMLDAYIEHINDMSRSAEEWEREMVNVALSIRMAMSGTSSLRGRINSISPGACYVSLDESMVEGRLGYRYISQFRVAPDEDMCRIQMSLEDNMGSDLDARMLEEIAREGGVITLFRLGDMIECRVRSISICDGAIELTLA
ncbi:MAG: RNB domain-containing ribonuclease [Candidatus Thermoplasmatota archaeon]|nr:RNB domain-containing ribonuclease [Candidatus Thermoplasmatota archaeon]